MINVLVPPSVNSPFASWFAFLLSPVGQTLCAATLALSTTVQAEPSTTPPPPSPLTPTEEGKGKERSASQSNKSTAHKEESDAAIVLTPFEVVAERDDGFMATNAGTATKLGLDLKDTAAPYSVITKDLIDALNLTNLNDIGAWSTNGGVTYDGQGSDIFGTTTQFSMRGEPVNGGQQRNFFLTAGLTDSYNTERVDFGRGPNAVLFNVGSNTALGGGVSSQTKQARIDRQLAEIALTVGSWDYRRATLDYNQPLSRSLALRVNAVDFDRKGYIQGEFQKTRGVTLAVKYRFTPNTEFRAEVQNDRTKRSNPTIQFTETMSGWDGKTVFDAPITNAVYGPGNATPGVANGLGQTITYRGEVQGVDRQGGIGSTPYYVYVPGTTSVMNWQNMGVTRRADSTSRVPVYTNGTVWSREGDNNLKQWISGNPMFNYNIDIPADLVARAIANSKFKIPGKTETFMVDVPVVTETTRDVTLGLTHRFSNTLFLDLSGAVDQVRQKINSSALGFRNVGLDINQNLPDGTPNPHYLHGYSEAGIAWRNNNTDNAGIRGNLGYLLNTRKLGNYSFNLTGSYNTRHIWQRNYNLSLTQNSDPRQWQGTSDQLRSRFYYGDGEIRRYDTGIPTTVRVTNWAADGNSYVSNLQTIQPRWVLNNWSDRKEATQSAILATAGRYFKGKLIATGGVRIDDRRTQNRDRLANFADLPADPTWDGVTLDDRYWKPDAPADWRTLTYIPKNADGSPRSAVPLPAVTRPRTGTSINNFQLANPLYANDRFRSDYNNPRAQSTGLNSTGGIVYHLFSWMSLKASYGDSYRPADTGVFTLDGLDAEPQRGKAYDARVNFSVFKGRLDVGLGYYYNLVNFLNVDSPIKNSVNNLLARNAATDGSPEGRNAIGLPDIFGQDSQSRDNKGYEIEITGKITPAWRVFGNFGSAVGRTFKRYPQTPAYLKAHQDEYLQVLQAAGGMLDPSAKPVGGGLAPGVAVIDPAIKPAIASERDGAINDYNNLWINYTTALAQPNTVGFNRIRINLNTDYTIQTGALKRLRFGFGLQYASHNRAGDRSLDLVPNPAFNKALPTSATNLPYMDNPNVSAVDNVWVEQPLNTYLTLGYTVKLSGTSFFTGRLLQLQLLVNNPLNRQLVVYQDGTALRPVNNDPNSQYWETVPNRIGQYQAPISFQLTARVFF